MNVGRYIDELVRRGEDDWVHAPEVVEVVQSVGGPKTDVEIREVSIDLIREVIKQGLMRIGDLTEEGFREWNLSIDDAVLRVRDEWTALGRLPKLGEIFWLANTEKGNERSRRAGNGHD